MVCARRALFSAVVLLVATFGIAASELRAGAPLKVMTYNVRYASDESPNAWGDRLPVALAMLAEQQPDLIGTQETLYRQVKDYEAEMPDFGMIGLGRDGGSHGEFMAIFYRRARLEPLEYDHFWLSDTPDRVGSTTWGNTNRRMVTWVRFRDRKSKQEFYFFNTHFDHQIQEAREKSAKLLWEQIEALKTDLPVIVTGDFNAAAEENAAYHTLVGEGKLKDTWLTAEKKGPPRATFHGFNGPHGESPRIDWILTRGAVKCLNSEVVTFEQNGQYPSDHFPVTAELVIE